MNVNQRKRQLGKGLSAVLALLLIATMCITVVAFSSGRKNKPGQTVSTTATAKTSAVKQTTATTKAAVQTTVTQATVATTTATAETTPPVTPPVSVVTPDFVAPVSGVLSGAYSADLPVFSPTMADYRTHSGIDIEADAGTPVCAAADGSISEIRFDPLMGQTVVITHENGYQSVYQNLQTVFPEGVAVGNRVNAGDRIGSVGDTALIEISAEPHLHFEIRKDGACENPLSYVSDESFATASFEDE